MIDVRIDESGSLQPAKKRGPGVQTWLMRAGFLSMHLGIAGVGLAWLYVPKFSAMFRTTATAPPPSTKPASTSRRAPNPAVAYSWPPARTRPSPSPGPELASKKDTPSLKPNSPDPSQPTRESLQKSRGDEPPPDDDRSPLEFLESRGLVRSGEGFLLRDETRSASLLADAKRTFKQGDEIARHLKQVEQDDQHFVLLKKQQAVVDGEVKKARDYVDHLPKPITNVDQDHLKWAKGDLRACQDFQSEIHQAIGLLSAGNPSPAQRKKWSDEKERLEETYRKQIADLRRTVDSTTEQYETLARDQDVTAALRKLGRSLGGPSQGFRATTSGLTRGEDYLRTH